MNNFNNEIDRVLQGLDAEETARLREVWESAGAVNPDDPDVDESKIALVRTSLERAMSQPRSQPPVIPVRLDRSAINGREKAVSNHRLSQWAGVLAAASVVFAIGVWWYIQPAVISTAPGETLTYDLPDGSTIELNSDSELSYHRGLTGRSARTVQLDGEGFFRVEAGGDFVVRTFNAEVRVLGTEFNVRARSGDAEEGTIVSLEKGSVALNPVDDRGRSVVLSPGETRRLVMSGTRIVLDSTSITIADAMAWRRGELVFRDRSLKSIAEEIQRRYGVDVQLGQGIDDGRRWNLALRDPSGAEGAVRDIAFMAGVRYRRIAGGFELFSESK